jgi:sugar/nucleoside kinase (ribokinase family)
MKSVDVLVVGEIYVDHVFSGFTRWPQPGEEILTEDYVREVGGGAATTACGLGKIGRRVNLLGLMGKADEAWVSERLSPFNVGLKGLRFIEGGMTGISVSLSTRNDRSFFTHIGVNRDLEALLLESFSLEAMLDARHIHFSMPLSRAAAASLLPTLRAAGSTTSLDVGYQPEWLANPGNASTLRDIDHFLPNSKEAEILCNSQSIDDYFNFTRHIGMSSAMLKLGAMGAAGETDHLRCLVPPPQVTALDTTGAGDAFNVGFIDALLDQAAPQERLQRACVIGALSTQRPGALTGLPDLLQYRSLYEQTYVQS